MNSLLDDGWKYERPKHEKKLISHSQEEIEVIEELAKATEDSGYIMNDKARIYLLKKLEQWDGCRYPEGWVCTNLPVPKSFYDRWQLPELCFPKE